MGGKTQMVYIDPPYGVKFGSNFQPFVRKRDVKHGKDEEMIREPEMVKAYRDTWELGLHSYLTYLRDRIQLSKELLTDSGSIFIQISEDNLHLVRNMLDEVFGVGNFVSLISYVTTSGFPSLTLSRAGDYIIWYAKNKEKIKYKPLYEKKFLGDDSAKEYKWVELADGTTRSLTKDEWSGLVPLPDGARAWRYGPLTSSGYSEESSK